MSIIAPMSFIAPSVIYCAERLVPQCHLLRRVSIIAPMSFIAPYVIYCAERLVPRCHLLRRVSSIAPDVIYCAEMCHLLRRVLIIALISFLFHLQNKNPTSVDDNWSSGHFPLAKVGCSLEESLILPFDVTKLLLIHRSFLCAAVCAARRLHPRFESPESALKVSKSQYLVSLKGAHTRHRHVPMYCMPHRHRPAFACTP